MKRKSQDIVCLLGSVLHCVTIVTCLTAADMKCKVSANVKTIGPHFTLCWLLPTAAGDNANGRAAAKLQPLRLVIEIILMNQTRMVCCVYQLECVHFHSSAAGQQIVFVSGAGRDLVRLLCCCG